MDVIGDRHAAENLSALLAEMPREVLAYVGRIREQGTQILRETGQGRTMIDRIDAKLLDLLQRTGPRPAAELGDIVGLSASACHRRIRALEAAGIITGYAARLDPERIGLGLDVFVDISLTSQSEEALTAFESAVKSFDEILECQLLSGASDYRLRVAARSVADFDRLHRHCLSRLPGVAAMHSAFALRTIKAFEGYPLPSAG